MLLCLVTAQITCVSLSGNTERLAISDCKGHVTVRDLVTGMLVFSWTDSSQVLSIELSYSGQHLVTCGGAKAVRVFDVESGAEVYQRKAHDRLGASAMSSDGQVCATGSFDGEMHASHINAGARLHSFDQEDLVRSVAIDAKGVQLVVGCDDGRVVLYDLATTIKWPRWTAQHGGKVWVVAASPNGKWVAAGDYVNTVKVYHAIDGTLAWQKVQWNGESAPHTWALAFSTNSSVFAIGHWDSFAYVVDTASWVEIVNIQRNDRVYAVALDQDGSRVAVGGRDKTAVLYRVDRPRAPGSKAIVQSVFEKSVGSFIYALALSTGSRAYEIDLLAIGTIDNTVWLCDIGSQTVLHQWRQQGSIFQVTFSPGGRYLAVGGEEVRVCETTWIVSHGTRLNRRVSICVCGSSMAAHGDRLATE